MVGTEVNLEKFAAALQRLCSRSDGAKKYLEGIDVSKWTLFHDGGHRWGLSTTNISESFNNVFRGARRLPIRALVEATLEKTLAVFHRAWDRIAQCHTILAPKPMNVFNKNRIHARGHRVVCYNRRDSHYKVYTEANNEHMVMYMACDCSCGKWQANRMPCTHALAVAATRGIFNFFYLTYYISLSRY